MLRKDGMKPSAFDCQTGRRCCSLEEKGTRENFGVCPRRRLTSRTHGAFVLSATLHIPRGPRMGPKRLPTETR